jgi:phosphopantothenoylcysteine decarboxylase/phosphopantothenate--cysteine ligase
MLGSDAMHPADHIRGSKSDKLKGRKIVLGVTGSIAAVECVKLCRELTRHGAEVHVVMSKDALTIIHPYAMEFASGRPVTTAIDGKVQHVTMCGDVPDKADLLLIAPATANTISKVACGIDDTPVTTFATTALGTGIPVIMVPAMHATMMQHKAVKENIERLRSFGVHVLQSRMEESKAKMPDIDHIITYAISVTGKNDLAGKRVLVIAGATEEPLDDVRVITNRSSGETGVEMARAAFERGASVDIWMGRCDVVIPSYLSATRYSTFADLSRLMDAGIDHEVVLFPAAVSDYSPVRRTEGKMPSEDDDLTITLKRNPKLIDDIQAKVVVGFKAQSKVTDEELVADAKNLMTRSGCSIVVANDVKDVTRGKTKVIAISKDGASHIFEGTKHQVAGRIMDLVVRMMS